MRVAPVEADAGCGLAASAQVGRLEPIWRRPVSKNDAIDHSSRQAPVVFKGIGRHRTMRRRRSTTASPAVSPLVKPSRKAHELTLAGWRPEGVRPSRPFDGRRLSNSARARFSAPWTDTRACRHLWRPRCAETEHVATANKHRSVGAGGRCLKRGDEGKPTASWFRSASRNGRRPAKRNPRGRPGLGLKPARLG